ncbi:MAG: uracil-DNA glycosylase [Stagnimonas sp.]|nr:uracil-DNA glycosylase [Stagnimonas sp.]
MDGKRKQRLEALGIETWVRRDAPAAVVAVPAVAAPVAPAAALVAPLPPSRPPPPAVVAPQPVLQPVVAPAVVAAPFEVPADWDALRSLVSGCQRCKLCQTRTQTVFGVGPITAPLMVVGEGPGADEDAQGEPFVGRAGKLLDEMLRAIGRSRADNTYIANVVKCRPPGNRDPEADEVEGCRPYLDMQIQLLQPRLIVALGRIAAQRLLGSDEPLSRLRGPLHRYGKFQTPVFVTYHPAYLLRSPKEKAKSWDDLKKVWQHLRATE